MVGVIHIDGLIGDSDTEKGVELIDIVSQVKRQPDATSFDVIINSEGGNVFVGFDIHDYLKNLHVPVHTIGTGIVASVATVPFMAGVTRKVLAGTKFMIHLPWGAWQGTSEEMTEFASAIKKQENRLISFYSNLLNLGKEALHPLLKNESWLTEIQLKDLGFVNADHLPIAARAYLKTKKTKMKNSKDSKENMLQRILDAISGKEKIVAKVLYNAAQEEVNFPDIADDDEVKVGSKATLNGQSIEGDVVMSDGRTFTFVNGELTEITEKVEGDAPLTVEDQLAQLKLEVVAKEAQLAQLQLEKNSIAATLTTEKTENAKNKAIIARVEQIRTEFNVKNPKNKQENFAEAGESRFQKAKNKLK